MKPAGEPGIWTVSFVQNKVTVELAPPFASDQRNLN